MIQQASFEEGGDTNARRAPTTFRLPPRLAEQMAHTSQASQTSNIAIKEEPAIKPQKPEAMEPLDKATLKPLQRLDPEPRSAARGTSVFGQPGAFR